MLEYFINTQSKNSNLNMLYKINRAFYLLAFENISSNFTVPEMSVIKFNLKIKCKTGEEKELFGILYYNLKLCSACSCKKVQKTVKSVKMKTQKRYGGLSEFISTHSLPAFCDVEMTYSMIYGFSG